MDHKPFYHQKGWVSASKLALVWDWMDSPNWHIGYYGVWQNVRYKYKIHVKTRMFQANRPTSNQKANSFNMWTVSRHNWLNFIFCVWVLGIKSASINLRLEKPWKLSRLIVTGHRVNCNKTAEWSRWNLALTATVRNKREQLPDCLVPSGLKYLLCWNIAPSALR